MRKPSELLTRAVVIILCSFILGNAATFNGVLNPGVGALTLGITAITVVAWLLVRWRRGWQWYRTPLDGAFLLWGLAFGVSLLANPEVWRRSAIGLWYAGAYIGVWYVLLDALANGGLKRDMLVDGLLVTGVVVLLFGFLQLVNWVGAYGLNGVPRPVSLFGNPNFLGAFLIVLIPLALSRIAASRSQFIQIVMSIYTALALVLLFLSNSRGAWLGFVAAFVVWTALLLALRRQLSFRYWRGWWNARRGGTRALVLLAVVSALVVAVGAAVLFVRSFTVSGRDTGLRTELYAAAVQMFAEKPITGQGLFTYGRELVRLPGIEPDKPHSHAHNVLLQVAAELGLIGLVALAVTLVMIVRVVRENWQVLESSGTGRGLSPTGPYRSGNRIMLAGATAAVAAFAVHQLTDVPAMMPSIALTGLIALVLAVAPVEPQPITANWRRVGQPVGVATLWLMVLASGLWSNRVYGDYFAALKYAVDTDDYRGGAERLQPVINADLNFSLYHLEQGFLYGMAANAGDRDAAQQAIAAYQHFLELDPGYALGWANLAALRWQVGEREGAVEAMSRAAELDPEIWQYAFNLGLYAEAIGDTDAAEVAYRQALTVYPDIVLYPEWQGSALRVQVGNVYEIGLSAPAMTAYQIAVKRLDNARIAWQTNGLPDSVQRDGMELILALEGRDRESALRLLANMERRAVTKADQAWVHLGRARVARYDGNDALAEEELDAAREVLKRKPLDNDDEDALNIAYAQFLRLAIPRWFLPQVYYPVDNPVLVYMIENTYHTLIAS
ncbi:MAG: O-antigen ligase family protein [Chloroflexi bacterium]|nr:O-antigen ligase family protein [Chloroflexota bacterium]